jgi:hypothetical protein
MRFLEIARADLGRVNLGGNDEYRHSRSVAIKVAIDEVQITRSAAAADHEITREMRLRTRCKGCNLLVPDRNPFDSFLTTKRVRQTIEAIADDAIDALDACRREHFGKLICDCSYHDTSLQRNASGSQPALGLRRSRQAILDAIRKT